MGAGGDRVVAYCCAVERDQEGAAEGKILWRVVVGTRSERELPFQSHP